MSSVASSSVLVQSRPVDRVNAARWFYSFASVVLLVCVLVGFSQFYFHGRAYPGREITPPIRSLVIIHGVTMSAWLILFIIQPFLAATRNLRLHMALGRVGSVLALAILVLGVMVGVQSARVAPPEARIMGFDPKQFLAVPLLSVIFFATLVGIAIWHRRNPAIHRAMMFTATMGVLSAALNRIDALNNLYVGTMWDRVFGPFFAAVVLGVIFLAIRCAFIRGFDRWLAIGMAILALFSAFDVAIARTPAWDWVATMVMR